MENLVLKVRPKIKDAIINELYIPIKYRNMLKEDLKIKEADESSFLSFTNSEISKIEDDK